MLEKNEMKLAMLNSAGTNATATAASVTGAKDLPLKLIRPCCRLSNFVDDETSERNRLNCLVEKLEKRLSSDNRSDSVEINRLVENAIHWCLVNGNYFLRFINSLVSSFILISSSSRLCSRS